MRAHHGVWGTLKTMPYVSCARSLVSVGLQTTIELGLTGKTNAKKVHYRLAEDTDGHVNGHEEVLVAAPPVPGRYLEEFVFGGCGRRSIEQARG